MPPPSIPHEAFTNHTLQWAFGLALLLSIAASLGVLTAFMWRDFINNILKYNGIDLTDEFSNKTEIFYSLAIALFVTFIGAAVLLATIRIGTRWAKTA